jgi:hypothetical protein
LEAGSDQFLHEPSVMKKPTLLSSFLGLIVLSFISTPLVTVTRVWADDYKTDDALKSDSKKVGHDAKEGSQKVSKKAKKSGKKAAQSTGKAVNDAGDRLNDLGNK